MAFDCLWRERDIRREPLWYRRVALEEAIQGSRQILPARRLGDNGVEAWGQVLTQDYEGLVGKDQEAPYVGGTTLRWLKLKRPDARDMVSAPRRRWRR
jgi:ATP-dependent DNA ligase